MLLSAFFLDIEFNLALSKDLLAGTIPVEESPLSTLFLFLEAITEFKVQFDNAHAQCHMHVWYTHCRES